MVCVPAAPAVERVSPILSGVLILLIAAVAASADAACPNFGSLWNTGVGSSPRSAAVGDFNRDGWEDLAVANAGSNTVSILFADHWGAAGFESIVHYPAGSSPVAVAVGDFNRDGNDDVAVVNADSNSVSIFIGSATGSMASAVSYLVGSDPRSLAVADINRDGKDDLAVTNAGAGTVSVLSGIGNGTFAAAVPYGVAAATPVWISTGDFNRDGYVDLATANAANETAPQGVGVSVLLGQVGGTFTTAVHYPAGSDPTSITSADFDRNGTLDLAVADRQNGVWVLPGNAAGTFGTAVGYAAHLSPVFIAAFDFTSDGNADLAVVNGASNDVSILVGSMTGAFAPPLHFPGFNPYPPGEEPPSYTNAVALAVGRFFGPSGSIAIVNADSSSVSVRPSASTCLDQCGIFVPATQPTATVGTSPSSVVTGDFDRDGDPDLAVANYGSGTVSILLSNGNGTFQPATTHSVGANPLSVATGDLDRDGRLDLVVSNSTSNNISVLIGENGGGFHAAGPPMVVGSTPSLLAIADLDRDGILDVAVPNAGSDSVTILHGLGTGSFTPVLDCCTVGSAPSSIAIDDFSRDGILDLAVANSGAANVWILQGDGTGHFTHTGTYSVGDRPRFITTGHFNRDHRTDLVVANFGTTTIDSTVSVLLASPAAEGTFAAAVAYVSGPRPASIAAADLDLSGTIDLAVANYASNDLSVMPGGNGAFRTWTPIGPPPRQRSSPGLIPAPNVQENARVLAGPGPYGVATGDFNRDGYPDLAVADFDSNIVTLLVNRSCLPFEGHMTVTHSGDFRQYDGGRTYTITVSNAGPGTAHGGVGVSIPHSGGITNTILSGDGWSCPRLTECSRADALGPGASFPPITVTVNVASWTPPLVIKRVSANLAGHGIEAEDPTNVLQNTFWPASSLTAYAITNSTVQLVWEPLPGAAGYWVYRRDPGGGFVEIASSTTTAFVDYPVSPNTAYLYRVRAYDASGTPGEFSAVDLATTYFFTDDPIVVRLTNPGVSHVSELRTAVNIVRAAAGLPPVTFTDAIQYGGFVKALHLNEPSGALNSARSALDLPVLPFPLLEPGQTIQADHVVGIRAGTQ
jgi:hypothetical protein